MTGVVDKRNKGRKRRWMRGTEGKKKGQERKEMGKGKGK